VLLAVAVLAIAAVLAWVLLPSQPPSAPAAKSGPAVTTKPSPPVKGIRNVTVKELAGCSKELRSEDRARVQNVSREGEDLVVKVLANETCAPVRAERPSAEIAGNIVTLNWSWTREAGAAPKADCTCTRQLEFRLPGAPAGDLKVGVSEEHQ
jgi:hypothetical protein